MSKPKVSIITVNFNQPEITTELFDSIRLLSFKDLEIIAVDNGSKVALSEHLADRYPEVKLVHSAENLGFSGGNNLGIEHSSGEYLFFVNNDTEIQEGCIEKLLGFLTAHPKAGLVSPLIQYFKPNEQGQPLLQYAGMTFLHPITGRNDKRGDGQPNTGQFGTTPYTTGYAHGAAMMMPRRVFEAVGPMPEEFFLYYEEMDWSQQVWNAGFEVWVVPSTFIRHKESSTTGKMGSLKTYFVNRNRVLFMRRNASVAGFIGFMMFLLFVMVPKNSIQYLLKGETENLKAFLSSIWWNFFPSDRHPFEQLATVPLRRRQIIAKTV